MIGPKVLLWDAETAPIRAHVWGLWENNVGLNQIQNDWFILAWAAKWLGEEKVFYRDQSKAKNIEKDRRILGDIWKLLNEADVVITHNGKRFDKKKINARFILNGFPPPSPYREIDTLVIAKLHFAFTSNKLEYLTSALCKTPKDKHVKFPGHELWAEILKNNPKAWAEMKKYNIKDVTVLEELYEELKPWDTSLNFNVYRMGPDDLCCNVIPTKQGFAYTNNGKYQRYRCSDCKSWTRGKENLLTPAKRRSLRVRIPT